jgi:hypothetical protein
VYLFLLYPSVGPLFRQLSAHDVVHSRCQLDAAEDPLLISTVHTGLLNDLVGITCGELD